MRYLIPTSRPQASSVTLSIGNHAEYIIDHICMGDDIGSHTCAGEESGFLAVIVPRPTPDLSPTEVQSPDLVLTKVPTTVSTQLPFPQITKAHMPSSDYTAAVGGGLKLKGINPSSKISKSHKKKAKPDSNANPAEEAGKLGDEVSTPDKDTDMRGDNLSIITKEDDDIGQGQGQTDIEAAALPSRTGKTEAELRHEERRRKRVRQLYLLKSAGP